MTSQRPPLVSRGLLIDLALELALVALLVSLAWSSLALMALQETLR